MEFRVDNFDKQFRVQFFESFRTQKNCDISFIIDGRMIRAHRLVVSLFSDSLKAVLDQNSKNVSVNIPFLNYRYSDIELILRFMYTGAIRFKSDDFDHIYKCAKDLKIKYLIEYLDNIKKNKITNGSILTNGIDGDKNKSAVIKRKAEDTDDTESKKSKASEDTKSKKETTEEIVLLDTKETNKSSTNPVIYPSSSNDSTSNKSNSTTFSTKSNTTTTVNKSSTQATPLTSKSSVDKINASNSKQAPASNSNNNNKSTLTAVKPFNETFNKKEDKQLTSTPLNKNSQPAPLKKPENKTDDSSCKTKSNVDVLKDNDTGSKKTENKQTPDILPKVKPENVTCKDCGKVYLSNIVHNKISLYPQTSSGACPFSNDCKKQVKFRRALIDHLVKFHKLDVCEEK